MWWWEIFKYVHKSPGIWRSENDLSCRGFTSSYLDIAGGWGVAWEKEGPQEGNVCQKYTRWQPIITYVHKPAQMIRENSQEYKMHIPQEWTREFYIHKKRHWEWRQPIIRLFQIDSMHLWRFVSRHIMRHLTLGVACMKVIMIYQFMLFGMLFRPTNYIRFVDKQIQVWCMLPTQYD